MSYADFLAYLSGYLHSNDPLLQAELNNFAVLGASIVAGDLRHSVMETFETLALVNGVGPLPASILAAKAVTVNGVPAAWLAWDALQEIKAVAGQALQPAPVPGTGAWYAVAAGSIEVWPAPDVSASVVMLALILDPAAPAGVVARMPQLLVRASAYEAQKWQGDEESAAAELQQYAAMKTAAEGYESFGRISLGGVR